MFALDGDFIRKVAPHFSDAQHQEKQRRIIDGIAPIFAATLGSYEIDTFLRIAHFMGQITQETAGLSTTEEFASGDAYEGRLDLGNTHEGDGRRYKGRGLLMLTGRANYRRYGTALGLPLEDQPEIAGDPKVSLLIACEYWKSRGINTPADQDDLVAVTKKVNGGKNGIDVRAIYLRKAKEALLAGQAKPLATHPVLHRGIADDAVGDLQALLRKKGLPLAIDNEFGAATELAVKTFQAGAGLEADGSVGPATWAARSG